VIPSSTPKQLSGVSQSNTRPLQSGIGDAILVSIPLHYSAPDEGNTLARQQVLGFDRPALSLIIAARDNHR
jgi:hypothetical protein